MAWVRVAAAGSAAVSVAAAVSARESAEAAGAVGAAEAVGAVGAAGVGGAGTGLWSEESCETGQEDRGKRERERSGGTRCECGECERGGEMKRNM